MTFAIKVIDISHHQTGLRGQAIDFSAIKSAGVLGVIHKASQGVDIVDKMYTQRRQAALDAGLLWGAYHFATADDADEQVKRFLDAARPDASTLMALDHERQLPPKQDDCLDLAGARAFLESLRDQLGGIMPKMYSGNLIKEQTNADDSQNDFFGDVPLWLCQYAPKAKLPDAWENYWLWQFSGDGVASRGLHVPGISDGDKLDMNTFDGSDEELAAQWAA
jgi:GH25 family lysozyme M1 (1,4-beta-N-acetylmuramidase)